MPSDSLLKIGLSNRPIDSTRGKFRSSLVNVRQKSLTPSCHLLSFNDVWWTDRTSIDIKNSVTQAHHNHSRDLFAHWTQWPAKSDSSTHKCSYEAVHPQLCSGACSEVPPLSAEACLYQPSGAPENLRTLTPILEVRTPIAKATWGKSDKSQCYYDLPICKLFVQIIHIFHCKFGVRTIDYSIKIRNSASDVWVVRLQDLCTARVIDAKFNFGGGNFSVHVDFALQIQGWNNYIQDFIADHAFCANYDANRAGLLCEGGVHAPRDNWTFLVRCCLHHCWASFSYLLRQPNYTNGWVGQW